MLTSFQSYSLGIKFKEMNIDENKNKQTASKTKISRNVNPDTHKMNF